VTVFRAYRGAVLALICVGGGACVHPKAGEPRADSPDVLFVVTNHHFLDITVYLEHGGQRIRVGTITAVSSQEFHLPWRLLRASRQFRLFGEAIGSTETVQTEALTVQAGQSIEWTLEHDLRRSSVGVY
jgi:hypothetical protein